MRDKLTKLAEATIRKFGFEHPLTVIACWMAELV